MAIEPRKIIKRPAPWGSPLQSREFVAMMAFCLALNALAIDTMLPALDDIAAFYDVPKGNQQQWIIFSYILGFGVPQLFAGPLSDRFGRKIILRLSFLFYIICGFACMFAPSFAGLLVLRTLQGISAAGIRVTAAAIIRDLFAGRGMARIMSFVMTIFMIIPIIAPGIGQIILIFADWRWTFGVLGIAGLLVWLWTELRLPETLDAQNMRLLKPAVIAQGYWQVITNPLTRGYMLGSGVLFGALFAFIGASEQIFSDIFDQETYFALWFAGIAGALTVVNFINARIVERFGMRRISHIALLVFIALSSANMLCAVIFGPKLGLFFPLFALTFGCFGMVGANFSALAMEPLGKLAGTGSAAYGFTTSGLSSLIGLLVASQYDGTLIPILTGYVILGLACLAIVLITEKGRLFRS